MNASENRDFFLVLARALDKDLEKRHRDMKVFARSLWQVMSQKQIEDDLEERERWQDYLKHYQKKAKMINKSFMKVLIKIIGESFT